jgi:hypothetical protein
MKKCSPLFIAIVVLVLVIFVFLGREMYTQEELRAKLIQYEPDFGPENFELLLRYADDRKNRRELDFSETGYARVVQLMQFLPDDKKEAIQNIITIHALQA